MNHLGDYDVIVIGAGHAGIEAAHAAATLGAKTAVFTMSLDAIGNMPCNPSIGGTAKGTLVRELDALGGVMGLAADATYLQSRMLNKGKGPAVHALRVQTDRKRYHEYMKHALELTPGLAIHQAEVVSIEVEDGHVKGVVTQLNGEYGAKCVVIATGTNLGGKIFVGDAWYASGPDGMHAANALTESLKAAGLPLRRFKTGTPARVHRRSIDFSQLECQPGDPDHELQPFSFLTDAPMHNKVECWIAYTNPETHKIILDNIQRSPLYGGMIEGVGPRYCPSIEDKVVRFAGKDRHPIFVEPCGENTEEMYLQGASSSLPEDVQNAFYRSIKGFENIEIMRPAYAIGLPLVSAFVKRFLGLFLIFFILRVELRIPRLFLLQAFPKKPPVSGKRRQIAHIQTLETCQVGDQKHKSGNQPLDARERRRHTQTEPPDSNGLRQISVWQDKAAHPRRADHHQRHGGYQVCFHRRRSHHNAADGGNGLSDGLRQVDSGFLQQLVGDEQPQNLCRRGKRHHFLIQ